MKSQRKNQWMGYICLLPLVALVCVFLLWPFLNGLYISFFSTKFGYGDLKFAGFRNYANVLKSEDFQIAIKNSLIWVGVTLVMNSTLPMALAVTINRNFRGRMFVIAGLLIPWVTPVVGFAMMNKWLLEPDVGVLSGIMKGFGLVSQGINFLGRTDLSLGVLIILNFWQFSPFGVLLLSSALSIIPEEQYDAMKVDGANWGQILKNLIMPYVGSMIGFLMFLGIVWNFSNYALINLLTKGGPVKATYTIPMMIFEKAFVEFNIGYAVALASVVGIALIGLGILYFKYVYKSSQD